MYTDLQKNGLYLISFGKYEIYEEILKIIFCIFKEEYNNEWWKYSRNIENEWKYGRVLCL